MPGHLGGHLTVSITFRELVTPNYPRAMRELAFSKRNQEQGVGNPFPYQFPERSGICRHRHQ